jgi:hypothetical protein
MDITDRCISQPIKSVSPSVELLSVDPLTANILAQLIIARAHLTAVITSSAMSKCNMRILALNQNLDDNAQKAMSLGMLIQLPIKQMLELLRDVGPIVLNIVDGIRLVLCRVYNICLEPEPC